VKAAVAVVLAGCIADPGPETQQLGTCGAAITTVPIEDSWHEPVGSPIGWTTNPPASGPHYGVWAAWEQRYDNLARGYWLHNAEHGGVVLLHRCVDCPDVVSELVGVIRGLPADPHCAAPIRTRTLIAADPLLPVDVEVAAVAWGAIYTATCVDDSLATFVADHYGAAHEHSCAEGVELGGLPLD
jgi:hypothetical protein